MVKLVGPYSNDTKSFIFFQKKIQNLCSSSNPKCVLPKTLSMHLRISYGSKVIFGTMTNGHFSAQFQSD